MAETSKTDGFAPIIEHVTADWCAAFADYLEEFSPCFDADETRLILTAAEDALHASAALKLNRVLLLELHAAKLGGLLTATDEAGRFEQFVAYAMTPEFSAELDRLYPPLRPRLRLLLNRQRNALEKLVARLASDREQLAELIGYAPGRLTGLALGQGDPHAGGQTVARVSFEHGTVMYKPRSLRIDAELDACLAQVFGDISERIRVPRVIDRGEYGWAAYVTHRYCHGETELRTFYRGLGHWLALLRLLGGTDIHLENLIATGPVPVVVDVESLFAFAQAGTPSKYGHAHDLAQELIRGSVLRTGIVPFRTSALGFDNVDFSAAGGLPGEQPQVQVPIIAGEGTTDARVEIIRVDVGVAQNHPSPHPELSRYWDDVSSAFLEATGRLRKRDTDGELAPMLQAFIGCTVRDIRRSTKTYVEMGRLLWHPASLHGEAKAVERVRDLFARQAQAMPMAPSAPEDIAGEIDDLCHGDVPVFVSTLARERVEATLSNWRAMRIDLEEMTIRTALVVTELNRTVDGPREGDGRFYFARHPHADQLDTRRRKLAAEAVERLLRLAVRGDDGTVTWIAPRANSGGWHVQPSQLDSYSGLGGVAVALAAYRCEMENQRADYVVGVDQALAGALQTLKAMAGEEKPPGVGGFSGYGGHVWYWLMLHDLLQRPELLANACSCAEAIEVEGFETDRYLDIIDGCSGAIVPLLSLAEATGDQRWLNLAARAGRQLESMAIVDEQGARWRTQAFAEPIGGFAHGASGMAWALKRLVLASAGSEADCQRWRVLADAAFAFQDALFDESISNWRERLAGNGNIHTWCGGSVGIGLAAADLYARSGNAAHLRDLRRAVVASRDQWGYSHTLCHGDLSLWELFARASMLDPETSAIDRDQATAQVVSAIEEHHGMVGGMTRDAFTPGLMTGLAGLVHSLVRMHPDCTLGSPLLLERHSQCLSQSAVCAFDRSPAQTANAIA